MALELTLRMHEPARAVRWGAALSRAQPRGCTLDGLSPVLVKARAQLPRREADAAARSGLALGLEAVQAEVGAWLAERAAEAPLTDVPGHAVMPELQPAAIGPG